MTRYKKTRFGGLPPRYNFALNPYPDMRISSCPYCERKTGQRKIPLLIHVEPLHLIALNYTCRYCASCNVLIAHKHELEHLLTTLFNQMEPAMVGNEYLIIGTVDKAVWREGVRQPKLPGEFIPHTSDFIKYYEELRFTQPGWYPVDKKPPIMEPPPSQEWVSPKSRYQR